MTSKSPRIILEELLELSDILGLIKNEADFDCYDPAIDLILPNLSHDLSISQIQLIVWEAYYQVFCVGEIAGSKEKFVLDRKQAVLVIGSPDRYNKLALDIRKRIIKV